MMESSESIPGAELAREMAAFWLRVPDVLLPQC